MTRFAGSSSAGRECSTGLLRDCALLRPPVRGFKESLQALIIFFFARKQFHDALQALDGLGLQRVLDKNFRLDEQVFECLPGLNFIQNGRRRFAGSSLRCSWAGASGRCVAALDSRDFTRLKNSSSVRPFEQVQALLIARVVRIDFDELFEGFAGAGKLVIRHDSNRRDEPGRQNISSRD